MKKILFSMAISLSVLAANAAESLVIFQDSPEAVVYDASWAFYNDPSELIEMAGKYMVDDAVKKDGTNSLRLMWRSEEGGDWGACIARVGWAFYDLTKYKDISIWLFTKNAIAADALPVIKLEGTGQTGTLPLSQYLTSGLVANTWTEVMIPIADFKTVSPDFMYSNIKSIFFCQGATDAVEHTLWIDEITATPDESYVAPTEMVVFNESSNPTYHDQSWINVEGGSTIETSEGFNEKFMAVSDIKHGGETALKLNWTSVEGGNWLALFTNASWGPFDLTIMDEVRMWLYTPAAIAKADMPYFYFEGKTGGVTGKVELGNYSNNMTANTWTEVIIPIADIIAATPEEYPAWDNIKGIFFAQLSADGVAHTLYIDDVTLNSKGGTGIDNTTISSDIKAYYNNGTLIVEKAKGQIAVYDTVGRYLFSGNANDEKVSFDINLKNGAYIVKTNQGSVMFIAK